jgi:hypothetical protein
MNEFKTSKWLICMGDFNSKIGTNSGSEDDVMGKHGYGSRNERSDRLIRFARSNELFITNSIFKKRKNRKWTWRSPDGKTTNEIDFILVPKKQYSSVINVNVMGSAFQYSSDHRMVTMTMTLTVKRKFHHESSKRIQVNRDDKKTINMFNQNFCSTQILTKQSSESYKLLEKAIEDSTTGFMSGKKSKSVLTDETKREIKKREVLMRSRTNSQQAENEFREQRKKVFKMIRKDSRNHMTNEIENAVIGNKSLKHVKNGCVNNKSWIQKLKDDNGDLRFERETINEIATIFYEKMYTTRMTIEERQNINPLLNSINKIDDITLDELKFAITSMKNNKATGSDNIPIDEEMVSFDVEALFPSVPTDEAISLIGSWLNDQEISDEEAQKFYALTKICLNQRVVKWDPRIYKQTSGLSMGNGLSPFAANIFMSDLEMRAHRESWFPRAWFRYVDDVWAIVKKEKVEITVRELNKLSPSIKFTYEREVQGKIPFLDLWIINEGGKIKFDIYRKAQSVQRYIPADSNHPFEHKMAAFNSMTFRLCNTPLTPERFKAEEKYIIETAMLNGYKKLQIERLVKKHQTKIWRSQITTLTPEKKSLVKTIRTSEDRERAIFINIPYWEPASRKIEKVLKSHIINPYCNSDGNLKDIIGALKDRIPKEEKSGIYEIACKTCHKKYRGQTKRRCADRYKEHERAWRLKHPKDSAMGAHCLDENHEMGEMTLIKEVKNNMQMDAWESLLIMRGRALVNIDQPIIFSPLFKLKTLTIDE